nr:40S ribosomal protein S13 [Tanacetum cinerariifolium]
MDADHISKDNKVLEEQPDGNNDLDDVHVDIDVKDVDKTNLTTVVVPFERERNVGKACQSSYVQLIIIKSPPVAPPNDQQVSTISTTKLEYYKPYICAAVAYYKVTNQLPCDWKYDHETSVMAHVPKPPTSLKPKPKPKMKKKKIKTFHSLLMLLMSEKIITTLHAIFFIIALSSLISTGSSNNYHGSYPMNKDEQKIWNLFIVTDNSVSNKHEQYPYEKYLHTVDDVMVVDILGKFAVKTINKSCKLYVNKDEDNQVSGAEFMECKFYKLTLKYIFYMTIESIEQGMRGVYKTRVECVTENGKMTLQNFVLTEREPKGNRPSVKPRLESEFKYETVEDGSSDPQDFYQLTGMIHRLTKSGGLNYHNPVYSPHILIYCGFKDKKASSFEVIVIQTRVIHLNRDMGSHKLPSLSMELNLLDKAAMDLHQPKSLLAATQTDYA